MRLLSRMRLLLAGVLLASVLPHASAEAQNDLRDKLKDLDVSADWVYDDWPKARERALREGRPLLALFR